MTGVTLADLLVSGVFYMPASVATDHFFDAFEHLVLGFHTPKAASTDDGRFKLGGGGIRSGGVRGGQTKGSGHGGKQYGEGLFHGRRFRF